LHAQYLLMEEEVRLLRMRLDEQAAVIATMLARIEALEHTQAASTRMALCC
jgi:hypothetical protein